MNICARCCDNAEYIKFVKGEYHYLCANCYRKFDDIEKIFINIERDFMNKKLNSIKHIDFE